MSKELVQKFCGEFPSEYIKPDIESNPNFVFENDTSFESVQLWDIDGNTVFVNSFIECEHYVSGGWDYSPLKNNEIILLDNLFNIVLILCIASFVLNKIDFRKYVKRKK